jgi:polysaccharide export outer membrane protein
MATTTTSSMVGVRQQLVMRSFLLATLAAAFSISPVARAQTEAVDTTTVSGRWTQPQAAPLLIGAGDLLDVQVFNTPELSNKVRVDQDGNVVMPLAGTMKLAGDTPAEAARTVEDALRSAHIMLDPHVTVFVSEYATQGVTVLGEVKGPGTYSLFGAHSLSDALAAAGGLTVIVGPTLTITHPNDREHPIVVDINTPAFQQEQQRLSVDPGDTIVVSKAKMIYVVGDVGHPGAYYLEDGQAVTILRALAFASGVNVTAATTKASIIRPVGENGAVTIPVDLKKIINNQTKDLTLQASDVLVVPRSGLKVFLQYALPGATSAVTSAASTALIIR